MQSRDRTESDLKDLLQNSGEWTLADDNKVCSTLAILAENIENRGNNLEKTLNNLLARTGKLDAAVQYLNVEVSVLKNSKFIEVSIDDDDPRMRRSPAVVSAKSVAEQRCEVIDAVKRCVNDSLGYSTTKLAEPRADKDLPPLIGSKEFEEYVKQPLIDNRQPVYEPCGTVTPPVVSPPENSSDSEEQETVSSIGERHITGSGDSSRSLVIDVNDIVKQNISSNAVANITDEPSPPVNTKQVADAGDHPFITPVQYPVPPSYAVESVIKGRLFSDDSSESETEVSQSPNGDVTDNVVITPNGSSSKGEETTGSNIRPPTSAQLANAVSNLRSVNVAKKGKESVENIIPASTASTTVPVASEKKDNAPSPKANGKEFLKPEILPRSQPREEPVVRKPSPVIPAAPQKKPIGKSLFDDSDSDEDLFKPVFQKSSKQPTVMPVKASAPEPLQKKVEQHVIEKPAFVSATKETTVARADKYKKLFDSDSEGEDLFKSLKAGSSLNSRKSSTVSSSNIITASTASDVAVEEAVVASEEMSAGKKIPGRLQSSAFANALNSKLACGPPPPRVPVPVRNNGVSPIPEKDVKSSDSPAKTVLSAPTLTRARPPKNRKPPTRFLKNKDECSDLANNLEKITIGGPENGKPSEPLQVKKSEKVVPSSVQTAKKADPVTTKSTIATSKAVKSLFDSDDDDDNCAIFK